MVPRITWWFRKGFKCDGCFRRVLLWPWQKQCSDLPTRGNHWFTCCQHGSAWLLLKPWELGTYMHLSLQGAWQRAWLPQHWKMKPWSETCMPKRDKILAAFLPIWALVQRLVVVRALQAPYHRQFLDRRKNEWNKMRQTNVQVTTRDQRQCTSIDNVHLKKSIDNVDFILLHIVMDSSDFFCSAVHSLASNLSLFASQDSRSVWSCSSRSIWTKRSL